MPVLPARFAGPIPAFAPLFVHRAWPHAQILLIGAILTPGRRTVTSVLPARPVLDRHAAGRTAPGPPTATRRGRRVVPQTAPDLRRCPGRGAPRDLARTGFGDIAPPTHANKISLPPASPLRPRPLQRRMIGQSRADRAGITTQLSTTLGASNCMSSLTAPGPVTSHANSLSLALDVGQIPRDFEKNLVGAAFMTPISVQDQTQIEISEPIALDPSRLLGFRDLAGAGTDEAELAAALDATHVKIGAIELDL